MIVGGGVIGLSLAYELALRGKQVRVLDRQAPAQEASWAGAGILPPAGPQATDPLQQLIRLSNQLHAEWAERLRVATGIDTGYRRCGGLYTALHSAGPQVAAELETHAAQWQSQGVQVEKLSPGQTAAHEPALQARELAATYRLPDECQVRNPRHLRALLQACLQSGVQIDAGQPVDDFELDLVGNCIAAAITPSGPVEAEQFVLASGAWSAALARRLGVTLPVRPVRGQMMLLTTGQPLLKHVINQGKQYLVPRSDGRLLVGSTEEEVGFEKRNTPAGVTQLLSLATALVPRLAQATLERTWSGLRPASLDDRPYLGAVPTVQNLWLATGHFRSGLQLSTGTALLLAQRLCGQPTSLSLEPFSLTRKC